MSTRGTPVIDVQGMAQLQAGFEALEAFAQSDVVYEALEAGADLVREEALQLVPEDTGALAKAIRSRRGKKGPGFMSVIAGPGKRWFAGDTFYAGFQEFGWKTGKRGSANRKEIPGEHFMEHAFEARAAEATAAILNELRAGIEGETAKARALNRTT